MRERVRSASGVAHFALFVAAGAGALSAVVFVIALVVSWGDTGWAFGAVTAVLGAAGVLTAFSTVYAVLKLIGVRVLHDPTGPYTFEKDPVRPGDVLLILLSALVLAALAFGASQFASADETSTLCQAFARRGISSIRCD